MYSKLNDSQILSMRSAYWSGTPVKELCKIYGISESTAYFWIAPGKYKEYAADLGMEIMIHKEFCDTQRSMQKLRKIVDILNDANVPFTESMRHLRLFIFQKELIITG